MHRCMSECTISLKVQYEPGLLLVGKWIEGIEAVNKEPPKIPSEKYDICLVGDATVISYFSEGIFGGSLLTASITFYPLADKY